MKTSRIRGAVPTLVAALVQAASAATFTVTNTNDAGAGSLRDAITQANLDNDPLNPTLIHFAVPPALLTPPGVGGVAVIRPQTPLPVIQNIKGRGIRIDGYTQPGSSYVAFNPSSIVVKVELDGSLIPAPYVPPPLPASQFAHGLHIMSSNNRVQGLCVHSFPHDGISIQGIPLGPSGGPSGSNTNQIYWNLVGTDVTGMAAKANGRDPSGLWGGIYVKVLPGSPGIANQNHILENVASGNAFEGVGISNCPPGDVQLNHVERCYVGIDITGTGPLGNGHQGIYIGEGAHHNVLDQNWVGANGFDGVGIVGYQPAGLITHSNTLIGNRIGVDVNLNPMPNQWHGVAIGSYGAGVWGFAPRNIISNNIIAYNMRTGVAVQEDSVVVGDNDTSYNTITQNSIHHNGSLSPGFSYLGIDLKYEPGVTPNDPGDGDQGANELVNFPVIGSAIRSSGTTTVTGTLDTPSLPAVIEVFLTIPGLGGGAHGQGAAYLGSATMTVGPVWTVALTGGGLPGQFLTATATDSSGNTSEFALNVPVWDQDGEKYDYGDAPDNPQNSADYQTLSASGGPAHQIVPGMYLGQSIDGEADGQPDASATGDDNDGNDDEDGVMFPGPLVPGQPAQVNITASWVGWIDAWIDFNGDGQWHSTEQIVSNGVHTGAGLTISYPFNVPAGAVVGTTFARVRYSSGGNLLPYGPGPGGNPPDGEVEDHQVVIGQEQAQLDWGDAPDNPQNPNDYPTLATSNGARHLIVPGLRLGPGLDSETDGQPHPQALGDDNAGGDDEDGVYFYPLIAGQQSAIDVSVTGSGKIDAWIDFNNNGSWLNPGEQIAASVTVTPGLNQLSFNVPAGSISGPTFARVRLSSAGGLAPTGAAADGEVEDYLVQIRPQGELAYDFGDAPDKPQIPNDYPTLAASNGARHLLGGPLWLGALVDAEPDGQPDPQARGDDFNLIYPGGPDDEDGVTFSYALIGGKSSVIQIVASVAGKVDLWIDWNGNGSWGDPGEPVLTAYSVAAGPNYVPIGVPLLMMTGPSIARVRISSAGFLPPTGFAQDGEVEDHEVFLCEEGGMDFGDAPNMSLTPPSGFPTTMLDLGAAHFIDSLFLGFLIDSEIDGQPSLTAYGDDLNGGPDDEDGVTFQTVWIGGSNAAITVTVNPAAPGPPADLDLWVDWNNDGTWTQANEQVLIAVPVVPGPNNLIFGVPPGTGPVRTYARFRLTHSGTGVGYGGFVHGGEVEDYLVPVGKRIRCAISRTTPPPTVVLSWTAEAGATNYSVYSSTTLAGPFPTAWTLEASGLAVTTWSQVIAWPRKFYTVVAFP